MRCYWKPAFLMDSTLMEKLRWMKLTWTVLILDGNRSRHNFHSLACWISSLQVKSLYVLYFSFPPLFLGILSTWNYFVHCIRFSMWQFGISILDSRNNFTVGNFRQPSSIFDLQSNKRSNHIMITTMALSLHKFSILSLLFNINAIAVTVGPLLPLHIFRTQTQKPYLQWFLT